MAYSKQKNKVEKINMNILLVHAESASNAHVRAIVVLGSRQIPSTTAIINDNLVRIHFIPQEPGFYAVHVSCANQPIEGNIDTYTYMYIYIYIYHDHKFAQTRN